MRPCAAAIAVLLCCAPSQAGTYTIDFSSLAADAGSIVTTTFQDGPFFVNVNNSLVIGPGDPGYAGQIGIAPTQINEIAVVIDYANGTSVGQPFTLQSISATFASATGSVINWFGLSNADESGPSWTWTGTAPATDSFSPTSADAMINRVWLEPEIGNNTQLLSLTIDADLSSPSTPEPAGIILLGIGVAGVVGIKRIRASC